MDVFRCGDRIFDVDRRCAGRGHQPDTAGRVLSPQQLDRSVEVVATWIVVQVAKRNEPVIVRFTGHSRIDALNGDGGREQDEQRAALQ